MNQTMFTNILKPLTAFVLVMLITAQLGFAQISLTQDNYPIVGDAFDYIFVETAGVTPGSSGADVTWDFSDLDFFGSRW